MPKITGSEMPRLIKALETLGFGVSDIEDLQPRLDTGVFVQANEWKQLLKAFERLAEWKREGGVESEYGVGCIWQYMRGLLGFNSQWTFFHKDVWEDALKMFAQVEDEQDAEMQASFQKNYRALFLIGRYTRLVD